RLGRDLENIGGRICGLDVTERYVATNERVGKMTPLEFENWIRQWYEKLSPEPFVELLRPGSVIVIDGEQDRDTGSIGSNNSLLWKTRGAKGIITSGGARDTDEVIKEKIRMYLKSTGR